ncbi:MAG TPA: N-acetylmuramoyl-L-alanine amidase [Nitrolancea sp.]|nr:N-acetylmuramoyl-L-alanine amidase [Nitrolancea sp.]
MADLATWPVLTADGRGNVLGGLRLVRSLLGALLLLVPLAACGGSHSAKPNTDGRSPTPSVTGNTSGGRHLSGTVYLDPGHGGVDTGTSGSTSDGTLVYEKNAVLQIALLTAQRLRADGLTVVMTRTSDVDPCIKPSDLTADGTAMTAAGVLDDLQCRIDKANSSKAQVLLSLHMNAFSDPSVNGTETYYDSARPFAAQNERFAQLVQQDVINALHGQGYTTPDRGIAVDSEDNEGSLGTLPATYDHLVLLGPAVPGQLTPSMMPGALCEMLFLSNPSEATAAIDPGVQRLIAGGLVQAIETFLQPGG